MRVKVKNTKSIINNNLTLSERGLLITILLLRDDDPKMTLGKLKANIKISKCKEELVSLHEKGLILYSRYREAKRSLETSLITPELRDIVDFMNGLFRSKYKYSSASITGLRNRLKEYSVKEIKKVVANRYVEWKDDAVMKIHLNPTTLFRPSKFEKYLYEANLTKAGSSLIQAKNIELKNNQEITLALSDSFTDDDTYNIRIYRLTEDGKGRGNGRDGIRYGRDIKKSLRAQQAQIDKGEKREFLYIYKDN